MRNIFSYSKAFNLANEYDRRGDSLSKQKKAILAQLMGKYLYDSTFLADTSIQILVTDSLEINTLKECFQSVLNDLGYTVDYIDDYHYVSKTICAHLQN